MRMNVSEEDIFRFVFDPDSLEPARREFIVNNRKKFQDQIDFCTESLESRHPVHEDVIDTFLERRERKTEIVFFPVEEEVKTPLSYVRMAAASGDKDEAHTSRTFTSNDTGAVLRILKRGGSMLLYIIGPLLDEHSGFTITFHPSETTLSGKLSDLPMQCDTWEGISKISLKIIPG